MCLSGASSLHTLQAQSGISTKQSLYSNVGTSTAQMDI